MTTTSTTAGSATEPDPELLSAAQGGDPAAFEELVAAYRRPLQAHCYRMLGSLQDAEDALQETLVAAWRGLPGFEGRASLRTWLYRIATNACLRLAERRPSRHLSSARTPAWTDVHDLGDEAEEALWLEPWPPDTPACRASTRRPATSSARTWSWPSSPPCSTCRPTSGRS